MIKKNLFILFLSFSFTLTSAMESTIELEQNNIKLSKLKSMIINVPTLKFMIACVLSSDAYPVSIEQIRIEELSDFIDRIKALRMCKSCSDLEIKFFINIINNPDISSQDIKKYFLGLVESKDEAHEMNKNQILDHMLLKASKNNKLELAKLCIQEGADVNAQNFTGVTALMLACLKGNIDIVKILVSNNANVNVKSKIGLTALKYAVINHRDEIVRDIN